MVCFREEGKLQKKISSDFSFPLPPVFVCRVWKD